MKLVKISLIVLLALGLVFAGCAAPEDDLDEAEEEPAEEEEPDEEEKAIDADDDHLIVANFEETESMDPRAVEDTASHWINNQIYDGLVRRTEDMGVEPALAEDWEFIDDQTIEFYLREDVEFHNGDEFTAYDVEYTYTTLLDEDEGFAGASRLEMIDKENIEVVDDYTIQIPTDEEFAALLTYLAHSSSLIVSEEAAEEYGDDFSANPVGTGPFQLDEWERGLAVHLESFDDHWRGPAEVEELTFRGIPEGSSRAIELETGGAHISQGIERTDLDRIEEHEELNLHTYEVLRLNYIGFNTQAEPFDDPDVRKAFSYALDTEELVEATYGELGAPASGFMNSGIWAFNDDVYMYEQDIDKAEELLADAGYEDGMEITMDIDDDEEKQELAEIIASQLNELGIDMDIEVHEWGSYLDMTAAGEHQIVQLAWLASTGDPHHALFPNFHSDNIGAGNRAQFDNEELDQLLEEGLAEPDEDEREEIYKEAQEILSENAPWIPLADDRDAVGVREEVTDFEYCPSGYHIFHEVGLE